MHKSPASIDGLNTQTVHVQIDTDIDVHCARSRKAARRSQWKQQCNSTATALIAPSISEGHIWSFGQTVKRMTSEEWDKAVGVKTKTRL